MAPERISILEDPNAPTKPTLNTLLPNRNACDVGLEVRSSLTRLSLIVRPRQT